MWIALRLNLLRYITYSSVFFVCVFVCVFRMQCADIEAENTTDRQWVFAKAVFRSNISGTVMLVRPNISLLILLLMLPKVGY